MAKKKRYRGHYCHVCGEVLPNERFSGKGHAAHICKSCARKPVKQRQEETAINRICRVYRYTNLSRQNRLMLERYATNGSERVRQAAVETLTEFSGGFSPGDTEGWDVIDGIDGIEGWDDDEARDGIDDEVFDVIDDEIPF